MKKILTLALALAAIIPSWAVRPLLVGHRGSEKGVENSVESFTTGAKRGYEYLETDFKVTADKQFVCSHDDDISRLSNSSLTIAGSTLAALQAVPFTQTRGGVKYTGRICSGQEYLDVCKEHNVKPLIELKWATGINNNDCSNIPMLIKFVEDNGFRNNCIIMTSMKPCLEFIRKNYPDIELQFLTGQYWANHFDWCVQYGIDVDIQSGYFDKSTVQKFHDAGLKVNMWTANTNDAYKQFGNWGCDFITTDSLDPTTLPELDASVTFPPNIVDYPNLAAPIKGNYETSKVAEYGAPLADKSILAAKMYNGTWFLLAKGTDGVESIECIEALTGAGAGTVNTSGVDGTIGDISFTAEGKLVASTVATVPYDGGGETFRLYLWENVKDSPRTIAAIATSSLLGNWQNAIAGERIAVTGRSKDLHVYVSSRSADKAIYRIANLTFKNGTLDETGCTYAADDAYTAENWGEWRMTVTPFSRRNIIIESPTIQPKEYTIDWSESRVPMVTYGTFAPGILPDKATGVSFHRRANKVYAIVPACAEDGSAFTASLHNVTDGIVTSMAVSGAFHDGLGNAAAPLTATGFSMPSDGKTYMHLFAAGHGMASFELITDDNVTVEDVDLELTCDWIRSLSTNNAPEHIDGTNAQQGTAVNGRFYIHDCADQKIHVIDESGYLGSLPGGAGYGCARDDAGNIIIRTDNSEDDTHSFLIYPAGALPDRYDAPVELKDVKMPLEGQTNYISAGGDLINGTGHIYLYPNKQTAINIVTVDKGAVLNCTRNGDLKFTGNTTGYVIPVRDDTERWIYQVRTSGMYFFASGENVELSTSRYSTTAPARNSTGGGAFFRMRGNEIFCHNSGTNYVGGFTVRNHTKDDAVVTSVAPIGDMGNKTGGNKSSFNWLIPEATSNEGTFKIYQYCPANGIAVYTLRDKNASVRDITADSNDDKPLAVRMDDGILTVAASQAIHTIDIYDLAGVRVAAPAFTAATNTAEIRVDALPAGVYIVRVNGSKTAKFFR